MAVNRFLERKSSIAVQGSSLLRTRYIVVYTCIHAQNIPFGLIHVLRYVRTGRLGLVESHATPGGATLAHYISIIWMSMQKERYCVCTKYSTCNGGIAEYMHTNWTQ